MKQPLRKIIFSTITALSLLYLISAYAVPSKGSIQYEETGGTAAEASAEPAKGSATRALAQYQQTEHTVTLIAGATPMTLALTQGETLYQTLARAGKQGLLVFEGTEYLSLGFFVTTIGSLTASEGRYLTYEINGTSASVGISSYLPNDGDTITWKLE